MTTEVVDISKESLRKALGSMFGAEVADAEYASEKLRGGTVGEVHKISGKASTAHGARPFQLVMKIQGKWDRHGDPGCWRREYDIYKDGLDRRLFPSIKLPRCYLLEETAESTHIWMEYVDGRTGSDLLHASELALAAKRLGELQAEFHLHGQRGLPYLRSFPAVRSSFDLWWGYVREALSNSIDGFPDRLRQILNNYAGRASDLLGSFDNLPLTLCQGDFHHGNLIFRDTPNGADIYLIDWDCAGYGRMGEDAVDLLMEAFVYSSRDVSLLPEFRRRILEAYCRGASEHGVVLELTDNLARDIFVLAWGFRLARVYLYYKDESLKKRCVEILEAMLDPDWE